MKQNKLLLLLVLSSIPCASAQQQPPGPPPDPIAQTLDTNNDGELTPREIRNAKRYLLKLDKNRDGALSEEELRPEPPRGSRRQRGNDDGNAPPPPPKSALFEALDTDRSGDLSAGEIEGASDSLATLDADGNRKLDREETGIQSNQQGGPQGGGPQPPSGPPRR